MDAVTTPPPYVPEASPAPARTDRIVYSGRPFEFRKIVTRGAVLEFFTVGFYRFWLATDLRRYLWSHTSVDGDAPEYTGTAKELLLGLLFATAILAPIFLLYFLVGLEAERYQAFASIPLIVFFYVFSQFATYRARRYRMTRTVWRGVRLWMTGSGWAYAWRASLWMLLTIVTIGFALPWAEAALERYKARHTHYGTLAGRFEGTGWGLFKRGWWLWLLSLFIVTIPFTYPLYKAIVWRWWVSGIRFDGVSFASDLRRGAMMGPSWKLVGWMLVLLLLDGMVLGSAFGVAWLLHGGSAQATTLALRDSYLATGLGLLNYFAVMLAFGAVKRIYLIRDVWQRVAQSVTVHNLDVADDVAALGDQASALGEGFADSLDVAGF